MRVKKAIFYCMFTYVNGWLNRMIGDLTTFAIKLTKQQIEYEKDIEIVSDDVAMLVCSDSLQ